MGETLLEVEDLHTRFRTRGGTVHAVEGVSFTVEAGEIVGIVGESGSGKSVTARSLVRLEDPGFIPEGSIDFDGIEMTEANERTVRRVRGDGMAMVFQDPMETLNPVFSVGEQIVESIKVHESPDRQRLLEYLNVPLFGSWDDRRGMRQRAIDLMGDVGIPHPDERISAYPHEFSGGMRQRAMLAIALAREPDLLVADEPTTALDVTIQAEILERIRELNEELGMGVLLITHDIGVVAELCDRVVVMYAGQVMEEGPVERVLTEPRHPYTESLLGCMPQNTSRGEPLNVIDGQVPSMIGEPTGCPFANRCGHSSVDCREAPLPEERVGDEHVSNCHHVDELATSTEVER
ncbi:ABC transporter ATP-binding protein [Halorarum salinum]|uniref:Nickel import system ATP-binding protein NikD n=1 Tax=Halorarum salinum TaxID=2743089 RepID=A0A7D5QN54_9EURY|nr:ABC transporter ATP-binding protein [Halobaculum salinum]QLG63925.1 ABC transporter ATP-binding protein [Halobaculum salinum]